MSADGNASATAPALPQHPGLDAVDALTQLGGVARRASLRRLTTRRALAVALAAGTVVRLARGRYALPTAADAATAAHRLSGVAILLSAAAHWGWATKWQPRLPQVAVRRGREVAADVRTDVQVRWRDIPDDDISHGWVTSPVRTVIDCAILLPFDEALAVADSALRDGTVTRSQLLRALAGLPLGQRRRAQRVIHCADGRAANPFESVLRALALDIPGLSVEPQVSISDGRGFVGRADLADTGVRLVVEAESFEFHGEAEMLDRDCARYSRMVAAGWIVLRFSWRQVMTRGDWVRGLIADTVRVLTPRRVA